VRHTPDFFSPAVSSFASIAPSLLASNDLNAPSTAALLLYFFLSLLMRSGADGIKMRANSGKSIWPSPSRSAKTNRVSISSLLKFLPETFMPWMTSCLVIAPSLSVSNCLKACLTLLMSLKHFQNLARASVADGIINLANSKKLMLPS